MSESRRIQFHTFYVNSRNVTKREQTHFSDSYAEETTEPGRERSTMVMTCLMKLDTSVVQLCHLASALSPIN